ncbi:MAG: hypothetical protein HQL72_09125 [Magnetococcales bacterium]|nr:hypothetical protein [Magnetococcales bacterium]
MPINGIIASTSHNEKPLIDGAHPAVIRAYAAAGGNGDLDAGLLMAKGADGKLIPYDPVAAVNLGTGDGSATDFSGVLVGPAQPGSVSISDGTQTLTDDGYGSLGGDGSGSIDYATGQVSVSFGVAVADTVAVDVTYGNRLVGVNTQVTDAVIDTVVALLCHGCVYTASLVIAGGGQPNAADLERLVGLSIYPV